MVRASAILPEQVTDAELQGAGTRRRVTRCAQRLLAQSAAQRPSLIVAASGGGTRAAVYTAVALEGMAQIDRARDVVLLSGVSGGGVSAAVFASRFDTLRTANPRDESAENPGPWTELRGHRVAALHPGRARRHRRIAHRGQFVARRVAAGESRAARLRARQ